MIAPASRSLWVTRYVHVYIHVSPTSSKRLSLTSPPTRAGGHNGSTTATSDNVRSPSFTTDTAYVIGSPTADTVETDGDFVTVMCAAESASTDADARSLTEAPCGSLALTAAVLTIDPASRSACVVKSVHVYRHASPTSSRPLRFAAPATS